ncbi:MAG: phosphomannomutase [Gammaproteobacteria bacterium]|nr:phosphomannomutase [Gammaproteobacteria bacterium]
MSNKITCFKAYDARGKVPTELNEDIAYRIGRAYAEFLKPQQVAVGRDVRLSSESLFSALTSGLMDSGVNVLDLGICGTEQVYFAAFNQSLDGGIMITASHNPVDYNGLKFVRENSKPMSGDTGLEKIRELAENNDFSESDKKGEMIQMDLSESYIQHLLSYVKSPSTLKPFKVVANSGNGVAGPVLDLLEKHLPFDIIKIQHEPDGNFPNGIPNPLLPEGRGVTTDAIKQYKADFGIAWDGDFDRCFLFDENGRFIEGYYIVGLLGSQMLQQHPGEKIIHDPRLIWNTQEMAQSNGGTAIQSKAGHAFIKEKMREVNAIYGGEMSAHHFFRDFGYCDSGMIPWLLIAEIMSEQNKTMAQLVDERIDAYPVSGEINMTVGDSQKVIDSVKAHFDDQDYEFDSTDGIGLTFDNWRFNIRSSNTEPLLRLNVESRNNVRLMEEKRDMLINLIKQFS